MRTWEQFLEAKAMLAPMSQQPPTAGTGGMGAGVTGPVSTRRPARLAPMAQQPQTAGTGGMGAGVTGPYGAAPTDADVGNAYAKSMMNQQMMARSQMGRRV